MKLTSLTKFGIFNMVRRRNQQVGQFLPLFQSRHFTSFENLQDNFNNQLASQRFKEFLPTNILNYTGIYQQKFLTIKLDFNPQNEALRIVTVRPRGLHIQEFDINNILPWSYRDMMAMSKWPQPTLPPFLDDEMIYINKILREVYIFESDGIWHEETVNHPKLSLEQRFNESEWFDKWYMN